MPWLRRTLRSFGLAACALAGAAACGSSPAGGPAEGALPVRVCAPRPVAHVPFIPVLPEGLGTACLPLEQRLDEDGDGRVDRQITYEREHGTAGEVSVRARDTGGGAAQAPASVTTTRFDAAGRLLSHERDAGGRLEWAFRWAYDDAGRLTREERGVREIYTPDAPLVWSRVEQTWEGPRLVSRRSQEPGLPGVEWAWRYDAAGRLVEGAVAVSGEPPRSVRTRWAYDEAGRPVSLVREGLAGASRYTFAYDAGGVLRGRTLVLEGDGARYPVADQYAVEPREVVAPDPAEAAAARPRAEDEPPCRALPVAALHGYPADEPAYALAFGDLPADAPLAWSYGALVRAFGYAPPAAFGHGGTFAAAGEPTVVTGPALAPALEVETRYDAAGRMVEERLSGAAEGVRARRFEGPRLVEDVLGPSRGLVDPRTGDALSARTLRFEHDGAGRLVARDLSAGTVRIEAHRWTYDDARRTAEHLVDRPAGARGEAGLHGVVRRAWQADGRTVLDELLDAPDDAPPTRLYARARAWVALPGGGVRASESVRRGGYEEREEVTRDGAGREVLRVSETRAEGAEVPLSRTTVVTTRDAGGRATRVETVTEGEGRHERLETTRYACD